MRETYYKRSHVACIPLLRINIDILGISELKWTGMTNLIQMIIISTTVGKDPIEETE